MNAYCPECETELDQATGICPACRWDPTIAALAARTEPTQPDMTLTQRYRGTQYDISLQQATFDKSTHVSRGRAFVLLSLVAGTALYGYVMSTMGVF